MNNSEIEKRLVKQFGKEKVVIFAEMAAVMYDLLHKSVMKRQLDDVCDYDFDRDWWKKRHKELIGSV